MLIVRFPTRKNFFHSPYKVRGSTTVVFRFERLHVNGDAHPTVYSSLRWIQTSFVGERDRHTSFYQTNVLESSLIIFCHLFQIGVPTCTECRTRKSPLRQLFAWLPKTAVPQYRSLLSQTSQLLRFRRRVLEINPRGTEVGMFLKHTNCEFKPCFCYHKPSQPICLMNHEILLYLSSFTRKLFRAVGIMSFWLHCTQRSQSKSLFQLFEQFLLVLQTMAYTGATMLKFRL